MSWGEAYAGYVNFWRESKHYRKVSSGYSSIKAKMDSNIKRAIVISQKNYLRSKGFKVK